MLRLMVISRDQKTVQSHNIKIDNSSFERAEQFKYLGTALTDQNFIQNKSRAYWGQGILAVIWCTIFCLL